MFNICFKISVGASYRRIWCTGDRPTATVTRQRYGQLILHDNNDSSNPGKSNGWGRNGVRAGGKECDFLLFLITWQSICYLLPSTYIILIKLESFELLRDSFWEIFCDFLWPKIWKVFYFPKCLLINKFIVVVVDVVRWTLNDVVDDLLLSCCCLVRSNKTIMNDLPSHCLDREWPFRWRELSELFLNLPLRYFFSISWANRWAASVNT